MFFLDIFNFYFCTPLHYSQTFIIYPPRELMHGGIPNVIIECVDHRHIATYWRAPKQAFW